VHSDAYAAELVHTKRAFLQSAIKSQPHPSNINNEKKGVKSA
jgi:hypothetical protein